MARKPKTTRRKKADHALSQSLYAASKAETHIRKCVWVPRDEEESFDMAMRSLKRRWHAKDK